jgi:tetratricopeptide (TPR) repeat protein
MQRAEAGGWCVLVGGCSRRGGQEPYAPLLDALERHIDGQSPMQLRGALRGCAWLVRLLPELADGPIEPLPAWQVSAEHERRLMFRAVARYLANVAGPAGTLLTLDDLQWAGGDAMELLTALLRVSPASPLRVLGAYRDTEVSPEHPLAGTLGDLAQADLLQQQSIGPLALQEARGLLAALMAERGDLTPGVADEALQRTGGVPYFVVSWARGLEAAAAKGQAAAVPWTLSQSIRQRVAALPAGAQEVLASAAVLGRAVVWPALLGMCDLAKAEVVTGIEAACRAGLLEEDGEEAYRFAHDIIREVIESDLGPARRAALHQRAGEALEALPGPAAVEVLAYHFARGESSDRAVGYLEQAADRARAQYANEAAAGYYRGLIARLERMDNPRAVAAACEKAGAVHITLAQYDAALEVLERAAAIYAAAGELEDLGRVSAQIGRVHGQNGTPSEGLARLQPLLSALEERGPSPALALLYEAQAGLFNLLYLHHEQLAAATRAADIARLLGDEGLLARGLTGQGRALIFVGRVQESLEVLAEARRLADPLNDLVSLRTAWFYASMGHYGLGELEASGRCAEMAIEFASRVGNPAEIASGTAALGRNAFLRGDWSRARADLERALDLARRCGAKPVLLEAAVFLGEYRLAAGDWEEAARLLEEAIAVHVPDILNGRFRHAQGLLAERDLLSGHPEAARDRLLPLEAAENTFAPWMRTQLAWAYLCLGDANLAASLVARAIQQSLAEQHRIRLVDGLHVQAMVLARLGQEDRAAAALDEGLALAPTLPYPYGEARLLRVSGLLHLQQRETAAARTRLEAARAIFRRLGASKDLEWTEQDLAGLSS